ncbi:MAG: stage II sporulation protein P [Eubacteriales bacterium]|nr:stage II sporulation protein P [Eubacteriales bacterium]
MLQKRTRPQRGVRAKRSRAPLLLMLLCGCFLLLQGRLYGLTPSLYRGVLGAQLPLVYSVQPTPTPTPVPPVQADIDEGVGESFRMELVRIQRREHVDLSGETPRILVYHTHATEAYSQTPASMYEESGAWRTAEAEKSVLAVGERLASQLRDVYGLSVIHDTTNHEPPKLATSYSRSVETMLAYQTQYPSISMFIDVHRDAYGSDEGKTDYLIIDGKEVARVMFVVGTGEGATGSGFAQMPDFESNYALAAAVSEKLQGFDARLARDIRVKTGRYNQHVSDQCLLAEVGHNMNTLEQALNAADYLAAAIADVAGVKKAPRGADWVP